MLFDAKPKEFFEVLIVALITGLLLALIWDSSKIIKSVALSIGLIFVATLLLTQIHQHFNPTETTTD